MKVVAPEIQEPGIRLAAILVVSLLPLLLKKRISPTWVFGTEVNVVINIGIGQSG
jgi:hypothetical protein